MTTNMLLDALKGCVEAAVADYILPTAVQKGDAEIVERAPDVYRCRLPESAAWQKKSPYILIVPQERADRQQSGQNDECTQSIRMIFCVTCETSEEEGMLMLLNVMDAVRITLLTDVVVGGCYKLQKETGITSEMFDDDSAPYFGGALTMVFELPPIPRKEAFTHGFEE